MGTNNMEGKIDRGSKISTKNPIIKNFNRILTLREGLPLLRGIIHFLMVVENPIQCLLSINSHKSLESKLICLVIHLSIQMHVTSSSLLHVINWKLPYLYYIRLFDHAGIFFYAALGHTSVYYYLVKFNTYSIIFLLQIITLMFSVFYTIFMGVHTLTRPIRCMLYLSFGLPLLPCLYYLYIDHQYVLLSLIILSMYTGLIAALVYCTKIPVIIPDVFEFHETFHLLGYFAFKLGLKINNILLSL